MATTKQKRAAVKILENTGKAKPEPLGKVLMEAGYAKETADTPKQVLQSTGFRKILEDAGVTDDELAKVLRAGLKATRNGKTDHAIRHRFLETGLKARGIVAADEPPPPPPNTNNFIIAGDELKDALVDTIRSKFLGEKPKRVDQSRPRKTEPNLLGNAQ